MKARLFLSIVLISMCPILADIAIAASSLASKWTSPNTVTYEQVFNAALSAGTDNNYTLVSNDRTAGIISFKQERNAGKKNYERRLNIKIKQEDDKVVVITKTSGGGSGLLHMAFSQKILEETIHNFHVYLFRELKITDPSQRDVVPMEE